MNFEGSQFFYFHKKKNVFFTTDKNYIQHFLEYIKNYISITKVILLS